MPLTMLVRMPLVQATALLLGVILTLSACSARPDTPEKLDG